MNVPRVVSTKLYMLIATAFAVATFASVATSANAATCPTRPLKTSPIRPSDIQYILPLGNLNPPDHTIPTDHIYLLLPEAVNGQIPIKNVYSPGDITVTSVGVSTYYQDSTKLAQDYSLEYNVCDQLTGSFGHISSLTKILTSKLTKWDRCQTYESNAVGNKIKQCSKQVKVTVRNGIKIGTVGGKVSHGLDLWTYDTRVNLRSRFVNPNRYSNINMFITTCPLNYYASGVQSQLRAKLGDETVPRTKPPLCGTFTADKAGTLRGNWFYGTAKDNPSGWKRELALVYNNRDGTTGAISVGGVFTSPSVHFFTPRTTGQINRAFETVTPSSTIYCYQSANNPDTQFLTQMTGPKTLRIEKQTGTCVAPYAFVSPTTYKR